MKALRILIILALVYAGIVVAFESLLGYFQPPGEGTIVITTIDEDGESHQRVLSRVDDNDQLYVSANHWPRAWYRRALANPNVMVDDGSGAKPHLAVDISGAEHDRLSEEHAHGLVFRVLTGFPPRYFVRLDPKTMAGSDG